MEVMGQWSDQEPLSPRLATGKSPADYWSICIVIDILLFLFLLCTYLGVCNNNNNNNNSKISRVFRTRKVCHSHQTYFSSLAPPIQNAHARGYIGKYVVAMQPQECRNVPSG